MIKNDNEKTPKNPLFFSCEKCNFTCSNKKDYKRHLSTGKHKMITNDNEKTPKPYLCECGKNYKHSSGLSRHKIICDFEEKEEENEEIKNEIVENKENDLNYKEVINTLINENKQLFTLMEKQQEQMGELIPKIGNITNNTNNTNNTINNNFNLNVFLNEDCKDALNISDFMSSLQVSFDDLISLGTTGFTESATKLLIKGLSELDITKRPIHCSDLKRETLYIKDNDVWEKESENKDRVKKMIKCVQQSNFRAIPDWVKANPGCTKQFGKNHEMYMEIVGNTAGLKDSKIINKIMKKVAKEVFIDKNK